MANVMKLKVDCWFKKCVSKEEKYSIKGETTAWKVWDDSVISKNSELH